MIEKMLFMARYSLELGPYIAPHITFLPQLDTRRQINNDVILKVLHFFTPYIKLNNFAIKDANFMKFKPYQFQPRCISYI